MIALEMDPGGPISNAFIALQHGKPMKIKRENVKDDEFAAGGSKEVPLDILTLLSIKWTPWESAMVLKKTSPNSNIKRRTKGDPGYVKTNLFKKQNEVRAIYEIGVRAPLRKRGRVFTMFMKHTSGFRNNLRWDRYLLTNKLIQQEVNNVVSKGGEILVRRGTLDSRTDEEFCNTVKYINANYTYAWNKHRAGEKPHRTVKKTGKFLMSGAVCKREEPKKAKKPSKPAASPAKKTAAMKTAAKKTAAAKETAAKKTADKKTAAKKTAAKKTAAKKTTAKKTAAKKTAAKKTAAKKTAAKKTAAKTTANKAKPAAKKKAKPAKRGNTAAKKSKGKAAK